MYIKMMSDVIKCLLHKYCIFVFNFMINDEQYSLFRLNKNEIGKDFHYNFYSDFLHEKFSHLFFLLCFTNDDEIYFFMRSDFNILEFSQYNVDKKMFSAINENCIAYNIKEICII